MNENEKDAKKSSEMESYEEYEGEAFENLEEGSRVEEISSLGESTLSCESTIEESEETSEPVSESSYEERKRLLLREKWMTVTGKKPRNIPNLRKPMEETTHKYVFFGDRKPGEVEKQIKRKLLIAAHKIEFKGLKFEQVRQEVRLPALFSGLECIRFHQSGERMACADRIGGLQIRDSLTGNVLRDLATLEQQEKLAIRSIRYSPVNNERIYIVGQIGNIQVFNERTTELLATSEDFGSTYNLDISEDGHYLVIVGREGKIHILDPQTLQVISKRTWPGDIIQPNQRNEYHSARIYGLKCHPTNMNVFVTGGWDGTVKIWDVRVQGAIRNINGPSIHGDGLDMRDNDILTATWRVENSLSIWSFLTGKLIKNIPVKTKSTRFDGEFLYTCRFFKNDNPKVNSDLVAVGGSGFPDVVVINVKNNQIQHYFPSFKPVICLDISGNLLAYGGKESIFRIAEVESKPVQASAKK